MRYRSMVLIGLLICSVAVLSMVLSVPSTRAAVTQGGTNFTMTSYNSVGGLTDPDYYTSADNWLYWKVRIVNNSGSTKGYVVQADSVYIQYKQWGGSWAQLDTLYTPTSLRGSVHVRLDNSVSTYGGENIATANGMPAWTLWGFGAGPGLADGAGDNFWVTINTTAFASIVGDKPLAFLVGFNVYDNDSSQNASQSLLLDFYVYPVAAITTDIRAVADTYTKSSSPAVAYGTSTTLSVDRINHLGGIWLKFPLTVPANWGVQHAYLKYYVESTSGTLVTKQIKTLENTTWTENITTYNDSGGDTPTAYATSSTLFSVTAGWQMMDIGDIVRPRLVAGDSFVTIFLHAYDGGGAGALAIRSKEYGDGSYAPVLEMDYYPMLTVAYPTFGMNSFTCPNSTTAQLTNSLTSMGNENSAHLYLQYQTDNYHTAYGWVSGYYAEQSITTITAPSSFTAVVGALTENVYYWCRWREYGSMTQANVLSNEMRWLQQTSNYGTENGVPAATAATIETAAASEIDNTHATLNAILHTNSESRSISVYFQISTDADLSTIEKTIYVGAWLMAGSGLPPDQPVGLALPTSDFALTPSSTYYFRATLTVLGPSGSIYKYSSNGWFVFETPATVPLPNVPIHFVNIRSLPDLVGDYLFGGTSGTNGVSTQHDVGGIFLALIISVVILVLLAKVKVPQIGIVGVLIILVGFFTYLAWVPLWIGFIIGLGFSFWLAEKVISHGK